MDHITMMPQPNPSGRPGTGRAFPDPQARSRARLYRAVAAAFDVPIEELEGRCRRADVALARQTAMYLAHVVLAMTHADIGRMFGRDRTTAAHACRIVEDLRDEPRIDALIEALEALIGHQIAARTIAGTGR